MQSSKINTRLYWIDCLKAIAIIAVVIDHCNGIIYTNQLIAKASYFSVTLFILLSGISTWITDLIRKEKTFRHQLKKISILYLQYAIATFIILIYNQRFFDLQTYILHLLKFSISPPFYFFLFFFQIMFLTSLLIAWCKFCNKCKHKYI